MKYIVPCVVMKWECLRKLDGGFCKPAEGMNAIGFIPVYDSIAGLVDDHGNQVQTMLFESDVDTTEGRKET